MDFDRVNKRGRHGIWGTRVPVSVNADVPGTNFRIGWPGWSPPWDFCDDCEPNPNRMNKSIAEKHRLKGVHHTFGKLTSTTASLPRFWGYYRPSRDCLELVGVLRWTDHSWYGVILMNTMVQQAANAFFVSRVPRGMRKICDDRSLRL